MYGLILEGIGDAMTRKFGEQIWEETRNKTGIAHHSFNMHRTYSETVIPRLAKAASDITGRPIDDLMELCGYSFVAFIAPFGYDRVLRVLGRHLRDLLSGLDNLHKYLKFRSGKNKCTFLTNWGRDKIAEILQTTASIAFSGMKISMKISLKFVRKGANNNIPALLQIMAWRRPGDKPLSEAMMGRLPTHICVTRPQWVKAYRQNWSICESYFWMKIIHLCLFVRSIYEVTKRQIVIVIIEMVRLVVQLTANIFFTQWIDSELVLNHDLNQCWPGYLTSYGVAWPQLL